MRYEALENQVLSLKARADKATTVEQLRSVFSDFATAFLSYTEAHDPDCCESSYDDDPELVPRSLGGNMPD